MDASAIGGTVFRSDRIPKEANGWKGNNTTGFVSAEITDVLTKADATIDLVERKKLVSRAQQIVLEQMPTIPLYFKPVAVVHRSDVKNLRPTGPTTPLAWNAHEWCTACP